MNVIHSKVHAVIDYIVDFMFLVAPTALGLSTTVSALCYCIAVFHFGVSICTQYEYSLIKLLPFPLHGKIEIAAAIALILIPWLAGFSNELVARNFFIFMGAAVSVVWAMTDYTSAYRIRQVEKGETFTFRKVG